MLHAIALLAFVLPTPQAPCSEVHVRALDGFTGPGGGVLVPAGPNPSGARAGAALGGAGRVAFVASVVGPARNQGLFVADELRVRPIAIGCGGELGSGQLQGCGDAAPTGGTFGGFYHGGRLEPAMNDAGDVLFLADVVNGPTLRGLFLYRAATDAFETVVAIGDATSVGRDVVGVGPGSLNAHGDVACVVLLDNAPSTPQHAVMLVVGGVRELVAGPGLPSPTGTWFSVGGGYLHHPGDNTWSASSIVPAIDDERNVVFWGDEWPGIDSGLALKPFGAPPAWLVRQSEPAPGGGAFWNFGSACFGAGGEIGFSATTQGPAGGLHTWFVGVPGAWQRRLGPGDLVEGVPVATEASATTQRSLAPDGSVVVWARQHFPDQTTSDLVLRVPPAGAPEVLARQGDTLPFGTIEELHPWPSVDASGRVAISGSLSGGAATRGTWILAPCGTPVAHCEPKPGALGCLPRISSVGAASASSPAPFLVTAQDVAGGRSGLVVYGFAAAEVPFQGGTLCVASPLTRTAATVSTGPDMRCTGRFELDFGARIQSGVDPALVAGATVHVQWALRDPADPAGFGLGLSDALELTIAP